MSRVAIPVGQTGRYGGYIVPDDQLPVGSTLGGPKVTAIVKANGDIEKVFGVDMGVMLIGTVMLRHYDRRTGMYLGATGTGQYAIYPAHQEHDLTLVNGMHVHEEIFVLNDDPWKGDEIPPPGVYYTVELRNEGAEPVEIDTYAYAVLRGDTNHDVAAAFDKRANALVAWNESKPEQARVFGCSDRADSFETTLDHAMAISNHSPGTLSGKTKAPRDPLGVIHTCHRVEPHGVARFSYLVSLGDGRNDAVKNYRACPPADEARKRTIGYYDDMLGRSVVLTPDQNVNRGVLWAKSNMLRVESKAPTGWCFTNDPTRSNNSVGRDTAWFGFGADYLNPEFVRESLLAYVRNQEKSGLIVEYYNIRTGETEDYGLNINDDTPLMILALWHHFNVTGDEAFLKDVYPAAVKGAERILSQRNEQGLVWCTAAGTSDWGIASWRNVIPNYQLSGAVTEVNAECVAALDTVSHMARVLGHHDDSARFADASAALKEAVNTHLYNPNNGLYYLNIDLDGNPHSDITSDLVFPVMFGVAPNDRAAHIVGQLSSHSFWTEAGMRTVPRDSPDYTPTGGWGLLGGVWVGVSFWFAFAASGHAPDLMAHALSTSFEMYSRDPVRHNTVPGQFSEWLNGETLVNQGMMLSPWFPPRYLWAAIEGMAGLDLGGGSIGLEPKLAANWKWLGVQNLPYRGKWLTWFAVRVPELRLYANFNMPGQSTPYLAYDDDVSHLVSVTGDAMCALALRRGRDLAVFVGNTGDRAFTTSVAVDLDLDGAYRVRSYNSLLADWQDQPDLVSAEDIRRGIPLHVEHKGFWVLDLRQEV